MDIQTLKTNIFEGAAIGYEFLKNATIWSGHKLQVGYTDYLVPAIKTLWAWSLKALHVLKDALQAGPYPLFTVAAGLFVTGIMAFKIADCKCIEDSTCAMTTWKAIGIIALVGATIATGFGISALSTAALV